MPSDADNRARVRPLVVELLGIAAAAGARQEDLEAFVDERFTAAVVRWLLANEGDRSTPLVGEFAYALRLRDGLPKGVR